MNKPKKSLRVREITAWHSAGFSPHGTCTSARTSVNTPSLFMCEHLVQACSVGPAVRARMHTRTRQCECTFKVTVLQAYIIILNMNFKAN